MSKKFSSIRVCDCGHQCESCGDCAYTEQQGDYVAIGRFCGPAGCLADVVIDDQYEDATYWWDPEGLVAFPQPVY